MAKPCWWALGAVLIVGSCHDATGLHVVARLAGVQYDALALQITRVPDASGATPQLLVDPSGNGRYPGPFTGGDQDVYVYLPDDLGGAAVQCSMTALQGATAVAQGQANATVRQGAIEDVQIMMGSNSGTGGSPAPTKVTNGQACNAAADCASNHCVDGVCCESDCTGACTSCALPGTEGLCRPVPAGVPDPRAVCADMGAASCGTNGLCAVSGGCAKYPAGTVCTSATCKADGMMLKPAATCDGAGMCSNPPMMKCSGGCANDTCS